MPSKPSGNPPAAHVRLNRRRYVMVLMFFLRAAAHAVVHDVLLRSPLVRILRSDPIPRWCQIARRYRVLAIELGGVLIKLGQFLSTRVDVLPVEVTEALAGLQDEVPAADSDVVIAQIEEDLGRSIESIFPHFDRQPLGAASLAQAHAAWLPDGRSVVVKVLRPGIEVLVETDLRAISTAIRWLKVWPFIRRRIDLDALADEFVSTTRAELDLALEAQHAQRMAASFADHPQIRIPAVYPEHSARRTLTEENVSGIKIADGAALERAGIDRAALARVLYRAYMQQFFVHHFVHADPHPGNLFVRLLELAPPGSEIGEGVPFEVALVDFGMVTEIPERLRAALRRYVIAFSVRDAAGVVAAYRDLGILLAGADTDQLTEVVESVFERFWGVEMADLSGRVQAEASSLLREFRHLLIATPVQFQVDLLFANRALELLLGLVTRLDPRFDPWRETVPFARDLASEGASTWQQRVRDEAARLARLPGEAAAVLTRARRGRLVVKSALAPDAQRAVQRVERAVDRLSLSVLAAACLVAGAVLDPRQSWVAALSVAIGAAVGLWALLRGWRR